MTIREIAQEKWLSIINRIIAFVGWTQNQVTYFLLKYHSLGQFVLKQSFT
jgi:hypothetical protein